LETRITVHEAEVLLWQKRRSTLQGNVTVYFIVFLTNVKLSPQLKKRTDFQQDNIIFLNELRARFGEKAESLSRFFFKYFCPNSLTKSKSIIKNMRKPKKRMLIISLVVVSVILGFTMSEIFNSQPIKIQKHDLVKINYQMWESDKYRDYDNLNPLFDDIIWITVIPITESPSSGLILGLYNNLLGKKKFYESDFIWLDKCIDQDRDGIDDITGDIALSYGNSTDQYFNTCLMIKFKVFDIQKA